MESDFLKPFEAKTNGPSIYLQSCSVVAILTKTQFLNPSSTNLLYWASWACAYSRNSRSTQTQTLQLLLKILLVISL